MQAPKLLALLTGPCRAVTATPRPRQPTAWQIASRLRLQRLISGTFQSPHCAPAGRHTLLCPLQPFHLPLPDKVLG